MCAATHVNSVQEDVAFAEANQTASEAFSGIRTVAAFSMQQQMAELYGEKLARPVEEARGRAHSSGKCKLAGQLAGQHCSSSWLCRCSSLALFVELWLQQAI